MLTKLSDKMRNDIWDRFWEKVDIGEPDECWNWMARTQPSGYGQFRLNKTMKSAHRIAFLLYGGNFTSEKPYALHTCNNPSCVNPNHLYAGNQQDNMDDKVRAKHQSRLIGADNPNSKLTDRDILTIRNLYATNRYTTKQLSKIYDIATSSLRSIINGWRWQHLPILEPTYKQLLYKRKLSYEDVNKIRRYWATGTYSQKNLAQYFNVDQSCISRIVNHKAYKYLIV